MKRYLLVMYNDNDVVETDELECEECLDEMCLDLEIIDLKEKKFYRPCGWLPFTQK